MSVYQRTSSCSPSVEGKLSPGKLLTMQHFPAQLLTAGGVGCVGVVKGQRVEELSFVSHADKLARSFDAPAQDAICLS